MLYITLFYITAVSGTVAGFLLTQIFKPYYFISYCFFGVLNIFLGLGCFFVPEHFTCNF